VNSENRQEVIRAKIVMVGAPDVGKTSLVRRFVHSNFSNEYSSTLGVKVDRKLVMLDGAAVSMVLWDMHGETEGLDVPPGYLRGAGAAIGVFDTTRPETAKTAASLLQRVAEQSSRAITTAVANKSDLMASDASNGDIQTLGTVTNSTPHETSALNGDGVDELFTTIAWGLARRAGLGADDS